METVLTAIRDINLEMVDAVLLMLFRLLTASLWLMVDAMSVLKVLIGAMVNVSRFRSHVLDIIRIMVIVQAVLLAMFYKMGPVYSLPSLIKIVPGMKVLTAPNVDLDSTYPTSAVPLSILTALISTTLHPPVRTVPMDSSPTVVHAKTIIIDDVYVLLYQNFL